MTLHFLIKFLEVLSDIAAIFLACFACGRFIALGFNWGKDEACPVCKNKGKISLSRWKDKNLSANTVSLDEIKEEPCPRCENGRN